MRASDDLHPMILDDAKPEAPEYELPVIDHVIAQNAAVLKSARRTLAVGVTSLALGLLSLGATAAIELGYIKLRDSADSTLTSRLGEVSAELAKLQAAVDAGTLALSDQKQRTQKASEQIASLAQRLELSQAQIAQKLGSLAKPSDARQDVTVPTAMPAVPKGPVASSRRISKPTDSTTTPADAAPKPTGTATSAAAAPKPAN